MARTTTSVLAVLFTALALVPAGAHVAEIAHKMPLDQSDYRTVQQIYRGWSLFGIVVVLAIASSLALTIQVRGEPNAFAPALIGLLCLVGTQIVFWSLTFPVNQVTDNWTVLPPNWAELRMRWEYSHAVSACLNLIALFATILSVVRETRLD
jgi:hypothetical protein